MNYVEIIYLVFGILGLIGAVALSPFLIFSLVGLFTRKTYKPQEEKSKIGVIISARNEEKVIGKLIKSLRACDYPQDKVTIFVVAHNCDDNTAEVSRQMGAVCYSYNNNAERTLGFAYRYLFKQIEKDYGTQTFDAFLVMNADNTVKKDYLSKMNDAFIGENREKVITSYRNSKNFSENYMSTMYGIFFIMCCRLEARGRNVLNVATRVSGTGYMYNSEFVKDGWEYCSITEDWEFSADRIACGKKIAYCDEAEFFDEQPTTVPIMFRQRLRWAKGHMDVFKTRFKKVVSSIFHPKKYGGKEKNLVSKYDIGVEIMPLGVITVGLLILQIILLALCPLFGYTAHSVWYVLLRHLIVLGVGFVLSCLTLVLSAVLILIVEHRRIGKLPFFRTLGAVLLYPFFMMLNIILDCMCLFIKELEWKPIPHKFNKNDE